MLDLYKALGLPAFTDDRALIDKAIARLSRKAAGLKGSEAKKAQKLLRVAKENLLDANSRIQYDLLFRQQQAKAEKATTGVGASIGDTDKDWDWGHLDGLLPSGEPQADFDLGRYLENSLSDASSYEEQAVADYEHLMALVGGESAASASAAEVKAVEGKSAVVKADEAVIIAKPISAPQSKPVAPASREATPGAGISVAAVPVDAVSSERATSRPSNTRSLARSIRRKKDRSLLLAAGGMLLSAVIVLGAVMVILNRSKDGSAESSISLPGSEAGADKPADPQNNGLGGGGRGSGIASGFGNQLADLDDTAQRPRDKDEPMKEPSAPMVGSGRETADPAPMADGRADETDAMKDSTAGGMPPADAGMKPIEAPSPDIELTQQAKEAWRSEMVRLRTSLGQHQYEAATNRFAELQAKAITEEQEEQFIRLSTAANYAEEFLDTLKEAVSELNAGSMVRVKSNELAFVEANDTMIALRIDGVTRRYSFPDLPVGILEALVDLKMDRESAMSKARRASFLALHPKTNGLVLPRAKKMMEEAEANGVILAGTAAIFDDNYELP